MSKIKLLPIETMKDGTIRLQSQLYVGRNVADFVLKDGVLKHWGCGEGGAVGFHPTDIPYEIVKDKSEMKVQEL